MKNSLELRSPFHSNMCLPRNLDPQAEINKLLGSSAEFWQLFSPLVFRFFFGGKGRDERRRKLGLFFVKKVVSSKNLRRLLIYNELFFSPLL